MSGCTQKVSNILVSTIKNNKECVKFLIKIIQSFYYFFLFLSNRTRSLGLLLETTKPNTIELNEHQREPREQCPLAGLQSMPRINSSFDSFCKSISYPVTRAFNMTKINF